MGMLSPRRKPPCAKEYRLSQPKNLELLQVLDYLHNGFSVDSNVCIAAHHQAESKATAMLLRAGKLVYR